MAPEKKSYYLGVYWEDGASKMVIWFQKKKLGLLSYCLDVYWGRLRPKNRHLVSEKIVRHFCPTIWAYIGEDGAPRMDIWFQDNFQGPAVPLSGRIRPQMAPQKWTCCGRTSFRDFCPILWTHMVPKMVFQKGIDQMGGATEHFLRTENLNLFSVFNTLRKLLSCSADSAKDGTRKIDSFVPENFQGFLFHYLGVFVPGTSVPLSGRIRIWFQENFQRFLSHYTAKDGARKIVNVVPEKFSGIFVPLSGRICARGFCPTIWTYIANRKIFREFCPTILPKMAPEKIDNFVPENFQGFLSHYLGVFVPGASVPLSGRILPTGKFSEIFVPLYCQRWHPKNWQFCTRKLSGIFVPLSGRICARDFCPTIWTCKNLVPGNFSEIFVPLYCQRWRPKKN